MVGTRRPGVNVDMCAEAVQNHVPLAPKDVFVLGVYLSVVYARWIDTDGRTR